MTQGQSIIIGGILQGEADAEEPSYPTSNLNVYIGCIFDLVIDVTVYFGEATLIV
jgi:hypothetical protein